MINPFKEINWKPEPKHIRSFGKTVFWGFSILAAILFIVNLWAYPVRQALRTPFWILVAGVTICLLALLFPKVSKPIYLAWFFAAACVGIVVSNLVLTIFFFAFFTPFAMAFRMMRKKKPLQLEKNPAAVTYWVERGETKPLKNYLRQY